MTARAFKRPDFRVRLLIPRLTASILIVLLLIVFATLSAAVLADEGEAPWIPVHQTSGDLSVSPDMTLPQWSTSHHSHAEALDGEHLEIMSIHNETYIAFLVERSFNKTVGDAGVAMVFDGNAFNSTVIWGWSGANNNSTDPSVRSVGLLSGNDLVVAFGRLLAPSGSDPQFSIGVPYDGAVKVTSWSNGTAATALNYSGIDPQGLELLPVIDLYPKGPLVYGAVLALGSLVFVVLELRRYRR